LIPQNVAYPVALNDAVGNAKILSVCGHFGGIHGPFHGISMRSSLSSTSSGLESLTIIYCCKSIELARSRPKRKELFINTKITQEIAAIHAENCSAMREEVLTLLDRFMVCSIYNHLK